MKSATAVKPGARAYPELVLKRLARAYAKFETFSASTQTPFQCLVGTVLSARTRDEKTAEASDALFTRYPNAERLAKAPLKRIEQLIKPVGFYRVKARHVKRLARMLLENYGGRVPDSMEELIKLPGVGRKVAGCVLVYAFHKPAIPVDIHVWRLSHRLGWVKNKNPEQTEQILMKLIPEKNWIQVNELLVLHGQKTCRPVGPKCGECVLNDVCPSAFKFSRS